MSTKPKAPDFLKAAMGHMDDRAKTYDAPDGERSMAKTVAMFNTLLGDKLNEALSEEDGWNFMQLLKLVRSKQGAYRGDNYEDGSAYAGLAGEAAANERGPDVTHVKVTPCKVVEISEEEMRMLTNGKKCSYCGATFAGLRAFAKHKCV